MKIILVMVMSLDGKTTKGEEKEIHSWTSKEDQSYFSSLVKESPVVIMGRKTYEGVKEFITLSQETLRVVVTRNPGSFSKETVENQLEFTDDIPQALLSKLTNRGFKQGLLVGGENLNTAFLKAGLVSEMWITVEPFIFGQGKGLSFPEKLDIHLRLISEERLNERGTLLLKYAVKNSS